MVFIGSIPLTWNDMVGTANFDSIRQRQDLWDGHGEPPLLSYICDLSAKGRFTTNPEAFRNAPPEGTLLPRSDKNPDPGERALPGVRSNRPRQAGERGPS